jgi:5,5'-dehydrodivanillate O-demethylase oxygenase subunit
VFPTGEANGMIYGFFGDDEPPMFPPYPESPGEGFIEARHVSLVPCNYLQSFENSMDEVHVAFTHDPGGSHKAASELPIITAEETAWGMLRFGTRSTGKVRHTLHYAPNIVRVIVPPLMGMDLGLGIAGWQEITFHFTPVDDDKHLWLITSKAALTGADAERFRAKRVEFYKELETAVPMESVIDDIWSGKIAYADVRHPKLAILQDIAVQAGQGAIEDRDNEQLGRSDAGIAVWRRILTRELRTIASGGLPKKWQRPPDDVVPIIGI